MEYIDPITKRPLSHRQTTGASRPRRNSLEIAREEIQSANRRDDVATCVVLSQIWLANNPDDLSVVHMLAESLYQMARYEESLQLYNEALARFPDHRWEFTTKSATCTGIAGSWTKQPSGT